MLEIYSGHGYYKYEIRKGEMSIITEEEFSEEKLANTLNKINLKVGRYGFFEIDEHRLMMCTNRFYYLYLSDQKTLSDNIYLIVKELKKHLSIFELTFDYYEFDIRNHSLYHHTITVDQDYKYNRKQKPITLNSSNMERYSEEVRCADTFTEYGVGELISQLDSKIRVLYDINDPKSRIYKVFEYKGVVKTPDPHIERIVQLYYYYLSLNRDVKYLTDETIKDIVESNLKPISSETIINYFEKHNYNKLYINTGLNTPYEHFKTIAKGLYDESQK